MRRRAEYIPTREEIDAACAKIRAGWSDLEQRRRVCKPSFSGRRSETRDEYDPFGSGLKIMLEDEER